MEIINKLKLWVVLKEAIVVTMEGRLIISLLLEIGVIYCDSNITFHHAVTRTKFQCRRAIWKFIHTTS